jgi:AcrR family transcriptional regulator
MFATHGYGATSMRAVVETVGCTKPALYYHFGSKAELFIEVHNDVLAMVKEVFGTLPGVRGPMDGRLEGFVSALLEAAIADPLRARLLLTAAHRPEQGQPEVDLQSFHQDNLTHLGEVLQEGQDSGEIRTDLSATDLAEVLLGMVHHRALGLLIGRTPPPGISRQIVDVFINGARP